MINYIVHGISNNHVANFLGFFTWSDFKKKKRRRRDGEDASQEM